MTPNALTALSALAECGSDLYFPFKPIAECAGMDVRTTRRLVRHLARLGYAEFAKGLWTEDGEPGGAGYRITEDGLRELEKRAGL